MFCEYMFSRAILSSHNLLGKTEIIIQIFQCLLQSEVTTNSKWVWKTNVWMWNYIYILE